jgi:hypothetical protein
MVKDRRAARLLLERETPDNLAWQLYETAYGVNAEDRVLVQAELRRRGLGHWLFDQETGAKLLALALDDAPYANGRKGEKGFIVEKAEDADEPGAHLAPFAVIVACWRWIHDQDFDVPRGWQAHIAWIERKDEYIRQHGGLLADGKKYQTLLLVPDE